MDKTKFLELFRAEFEDTDPDIIVFESEFRVFEDWSSLVGLSILVMVQENYGIQMTATDLRACKTVEDVFNFVSSKL